MRELKPCPFCGGYHVTNEGVTNKSIHCVDCGAYGPEPAYDDNEIDVDWNTRAVPKVKALEWREANWKGVKEQASTNGICEYRAFHRPDRSVYGAIAHLSNVDTQPIGLNFFSMDEAKAAAQSHYEKLILEALE